MSLYLRYVFFQGFILGDDAEEFALLQRILAQHGPDFVGHLEYRFNIWIFNYVVLSYLGISEPTFFLPTVLMSGSLGVVAYHILRLWRYRTPHALWGGLFVASAPFEVLIGTLRANDLILGWFLALGLLALVAFEARPGVQGIALGVLLWLAFYVKLWAVYFLPAIGLYYFARRPRAWIGPASFALTSLVLHALAATFWKIKMGLFLPFISYHSATYVVARRDLGETFCKYPRLIFSGSEFGTTFFGYVPYLLVALLALKVIGSAYAGKGAGALRLDRGDTTLVAYYGSFLLLVNFVPNSFAFDHYYSAPRIFRYLTPVSFPMALHTAKLLLDLVKTDFLRRSRLASGVLLLGGLCMNLYHANEATHPGRVYRHALLSMARDVRAENPPRLIVESWLSFFLTFVYLRDLREGTIITNVNIYRAREYERWLNEMQHTLPEGSMLVTGLASHVHYGGHDGGFRLRRFGGHLHPSWKLVKEYDVLDYLALPEPARLWRLSGTIGDPATSRQVAPRDVDAIFGAGMRRFSEGDCTQAGKYFAKIVREFYDREKADAALYFHGICRLRRGDFRGSVVEFERLVEDFPHSASSAGAHYHMGLSYKGLGDLARARKEFGYLLTHFSSDPNLVGIARTQIDELERAR